MKREIKFRAWDKDMREMVFVSGIQFDPHSPQKRPNIIDERNDIRDLEDVILMQFTGLKDKKGVEIYEGDIVTDNHWIGEVVYKNTIVDDYDEYPSKSVSGFYIEVDDGDFLIDDFNGYKIIGNIYEDLN